MLCRMMPAQPPLHVRLAVVLGCVGLLGAALRSEAAPPIDGGSDAFNWMYGAGPPPGLSYGEPETDNVWASFGCETRSGRVKLHITSGGEPAHAYGSHWRARVRMASGDRRRAYMARGEGGDLGEEISAVIPTRDPVLRAFAQSGRLSIDGYRQNAETPAERRAIRAFLAACR
jgi:hypothetical protein